MKDLIEKAKNILIEKVSQDELNNLLDAMRGFEGNLKEVTFINKNYNTSHRFRIISNDFDVSGGDPIIYMDRKKSSMQFHSDKIKLVKFNPTKTKVTVEFHK
jgi:hypothetical protein